MTTTITRDAANFWWNEISKRKIEIPKDVAYFEKKAYSHEWREVTWTDIHAKRTDSIKARIWVKRQHAVIKPCLVWVFSHGYFLMGGYYTIIKTLDKEFYLNFRGVGVLNEGKLKQQVMRCFPLCLPIEDLFYEWMQNFCVAYKNNQFYKGWKKQGVTRAYCRINESGYLTDIANTATELRVEKNNEPHIP